MTIIYMHPTVDGLSGGPLLMSTTTDSFDIIGIHKGTQANFNYGLQLKCL